METKKPKYGTVAILKVAVGTGSPAVPGTAVSPCYQPKAAGATLGVCTDFTSIPPLPVKGETSWPRQDAASETWLELLEPEL